MEWLLYVFALLFGVVVGRLTAPRAVTHHFGQPVPQADANAPSSNVRKAREICAQRQHTDNAALMRPVVNVHEGARICSVRQYNSIETG
jgi:hypothetical protein